MDTASIVQALRQERDRISSALSALEGSSTIRTARRGTGNGRRKRRVRRLSPAARRKISQAAKARWAKAKRAGRNSL